jgi:hypothetical protein
VDVFSDDRREPVNQRMRDRILLLVRACVTEQCVRTILSSRYRTRR